MTAQPRLLFVAKPQLEVRSAMEQAVAACGLDTSLGGALFMPENWHQSLSGTYKTNTAADVNSFLRAGSRIAATAVKMRFNRIKSQGSATRKIHWEFLTLGNPDGFHELVFAVQAAIRAEGIGARTVRRPHVTISYWAPSQLPSQMIAPIDWEIDAVLLVEGGGHPYRYTTLAQWPLTPVPIRQLPLF